MEKYILTLDLGTTNLKAIIFNKQFEEIASVNFNYSLITNGDFVEFEAEDYWNACKKVLRKVIEKSSINPERIISISITSQAETLIILNRNGEPVRKAISWLDSRSKEECKILSRQFNQEESYAITGQPCVIPNWPITKILWLKRNENKSFKNTYKFLLLKDYIIYKLIGNYISEYTINNFSYYFDINKKEYWKEIIEFVGIDREQLPVLKEAGTNIGNPLMSVINEFGFSKDIKINIGSLDQMSAMIGVGNIKKDIVSESTGTVMAIGTLIDKPIINQFKIPCHYNAIKDTYILLPVCESGGICLEWFKKNFEDEKTYDDLDKEIDNVDISSNDLLFLPYIAGINSPEFNPKAKGVFYGIRLEHQKEHFLRAIYEGVAYLLKKNIDILEKLGVKVEKIISSGGGSESNAWNQIKADITGKKVVTTRNSESASLGAAILAAVECDLYQKVEDAVEFSVKVKREFEPKKIDRYKRKYSLFNQVYERLY